MKRLCGALAILLACGEGSYALDREQRRAQVLLRELCGSCHAVGRTGRSPHAYAPAFRTLPETTLYDDDFGQRLQNGLSTMHPDMPTFHFSERDAEAVVDYLRTIQDSAKRAR
jgi:mono/diheme cytochrome c family protein